MPKILQDEEIYTFRSYFEMPYDVDRILAEFGYSFQSDRLNLPSANVTFPQLACLSQDIESNLKLTLLGSETARREAIVAPILFAVARFCSCQIRIEYPLNVNNWLQGNLDYLLIAEQNLLVVEAKKDDLTKGFTQMAIELIALAEEKSQPCLYGAVTTGDAWRFGMLNVKDKIIFQDIALFAVPDRLDVLFQIIVGILTQKIT